MKNKKELQAENSGLKEELSDIKVKFAKLSEKYEVLQKQSNQNNRREEMSIKCDECDFVVGNISELRKHKNIHKGIEKFCCCVCSQDFDEEWKMEAHKKKHKSFACDQCGKNFKFMDIMEKHKKISHEKCRLYCHYFNNMKTCPFDNECVFLHEDADKCRYGESCDRILCMFKHDNVISETEETSNTSEMSVQEVVADVHEDEIVTVDSVIDTIETDVSEDIAKLAFKCRMCDFASARKTNLKNHKKTIHHWCFICFSSYSSQENLKNHFLNAHSNKQEDLELALGEAPR